MALNSVQIIETGGATVREYAQEAATTILAGEPVKLGGTGGNYVLRLATGDPEAGTDRMVGITTSSGTATASADGVVRVLEVIPEKTVMRCKVTTAANMDTAAEFLGIRYDSVCFDESAAVFTVDEDEGDDPNVHGLSIVSGNIASGTIDFVLHEYSAKGGPV
jgi:hypothetical protein